MEALGRRTLRRGDAVVAAAALLRAAELTPSRADRTRRMAEAAYIGANVTGELRDVVRLLREADQSGTDLHDSLEASVAAAYLRTAKAMWILPIGCSPVRLSIRPNTWTSTTPPLSRRCTRCCWCVSFGGRPELWASFFALLAELGPGVPRVLDVCSKTFPDPGHRLAAAVEALAETISGLRDMDDPTEIVRIGIAADYVDQLGGCRDALWRVIGDGRAGGAVGSAINALFLLAVDDCIQVSGSRPTRCSRRGWRCAQRVATASWPGRVSTFERCSPQRGVIRAPRCASPTICRAGPSRVASYVVRWYCCRAGPWQHLARVISSTPISRRPP